MKKFLFNLIAAVIVGAVSFGIFLWLFGWKEKEALSLGLSVAFSGLLVEYFKPLLNKKRVTKAGE